MWDVVSEGAADLSSCLCPGQRRATCADQQGRPGAQGVPEPAAPPPLPARQVPAAQGHVPDPGRCGRRVLQPQCRQHHPTAAGHGADLTEAPGTHREQTCFCLRVGACLSCALFLSCSLMATAALKVGPVSRRTFLCAKLDSAEFGRGQCRHLCKLQFPLRLRTLGLPLLQLLGIPREEGGRGHHSTLRGPAPAPSCMAASEEQSQAWSEGDREQPEKPGVAISVPWAYGRAKAAGMFGAGALKWVARW